MVEGSSSQSKLGGSSILAVGGAASILTGMIMGMMGYSATELFISGESGRCALGSTTLEVDSLRGTLYIRDLGAALTFL